MSNLCADYRECQAAVRYRCQAYLEDRSCWEMRVVPCCHRRNKDRCEECPVYLGCKNQGSLACGALGERGLVS